jgi:hypothetical protein
MGKIRKVITTRFIDDEKGFEFYHEPVKDTLIIQETPEGFEARYLVQDDSAMPPDEMDDDNLFLVNYHRDFDVRRDKIITENDLQNWYRKDFSDYDDGEGNLPDNIPQAAEYWIFSLAAYIHGGVCLSLGSGSHFPDQRWDVSHVGAVLVNRKEWPTKNKAIEAAENKVKEWNQYLSGDVYGIVKETYNKEKKQVDHDSCWGFYGHRYALEALQTDT